MFDPMTDVPSTEAECEIALRHGKDRIVAEAMVGIFQVRMMQGQEMLEAYMDALLAYVEAYDEAHPSPQDD